ncbi:MAG: exodeoxyribonuclease V subunit gamma, partial [Nitriliruptorales bacterium]|nr:exodeoxyribonuclease V subunit gamma [Nitriliruptorales bacterium]
MLRAWVDGDDDDGAGGRLPPDARWQPRLWRHLRDRIAEPSPAERLPDACERLAGDRALLDWPRRVSLFGLTRLPASYLQALAAVARQRDVHLFLLHPSPVLWDSVRAAVSSHGVPRRRDGDHTAALPGNPLLASWGRDAREMQLVLAAAADQSRESHTGVQLAATSLLQRLQADVHADRPPPGAPLPGDTDRRALLGVNDDSVRVHSCHGRARQVDVVRDAILHLLDTHDDLEPRDVIVMCPDIETFAPLIHAAFGVGGEETDRVETVEPGNRPAGLRVRLADRSLRQTNPVLAVVARLLELAESRVTASEMLDLIAREPVCRRFRFDGDELARLEEWIPMAGIRWGIDAAHRAPFRLGDVEANTWTAGVQRLLVGAAMAERDGRLVAGVLPVDDVSSGDLDLAGRFAELLDRVTDAIDALQGPHPITGWAAALAGAADALTATSPTAAWQRAQLQRILDEVVDEAGGDGANGATLRLAEVRALLADRLRGRPTRANFRTGHVTICTMVPMRSVPHRVVCLLGLDDQSFPRRTTPEGDDLLSRKPHVGDREPRSEDRQLLLDALLAARDHLVITYAGRSERTNERRPPAVPLGELLDTIDATVQTGDVEDGVAVAARARVVAEHPLQPFDDRNFRSGEITPQRPWSFDAVALAGAQALAAGTVERPAFVSGPLDAETDDVVELEELIRFVQHPVKAFLRRRLGIRLTDRDEEPEDNLPVELDGLAQWTVGQSLLDGRLGGMDAATCAAVERARGTLPPGALATAYLQRIGPVVDQLADVAAQHADGEPAAPDVNIRLPGGRSLVGSVPGVFGPTIRAVSYSRLGAKHRLAAWLRLLAASVSQPAEAWTAVTIGKHMRGRAGVSISKLGLRQGGAAERRESATAALLDIVELFDRGMSQPLPLYCDTSGAYARARRNGWEAASNGARTWASTFKYTGEDVHPEHQLVLGGQVPFADLLVETPHAHERGEGWDEDEESRFGRYAMRLWGPLLDAEELDGG